MVATLAQALGVEIPTTAYPAFDKGTNYIPYDMMAQVHEGERIIPAADNEQLMRALDNDSDDEMARAIMELKEEVCKLREENTRNAIMLAGVTRESNNQNADTIVEGTKEAIRDSSDRSSYNAKANKVL
jgi:flagellar biosynthesis/type III secretory pathway chaperone